MANEYLKVNGKLVMINNQLVKMPNETEYSDALDNQSISLASTEELVSDILTKLTGYIDGSPKQVFDTLNTLKATYPNGAIGTYLCKDTKHYYIYNGGWIDCGEYLANPFEVTLQNGAVISQNADFAEIGKGSIGAGYFVTATGYDTSTNVPIIQKANSTSDIRGVTVANPAFCAGIKSSMLNDGVLRAGYSYVGFAGVVNVIDNGKCTVNGVLAKRCMSDNDGTATPSSNNMGYQIISRVNSTTIKIIVEPSADMIQRIKTDMSNKPSYDTTKGSGTDVVVQLHPENNPQDNLYPELLPKQKFYANVDFEVLSSREIYGKILTLKVEKNPEEEIQSGDYVAYDYATKKAKKLSNNIDGYEVYSVDNENNTIEIIYSNNKEVINILNEGLKTLAFKNLLDEKKLENIEVGIIKSHNDDRIAFSKKEIPSGTRCIIKSSVYEIANYNQENWGNEIIANGTRIRVRRFDKRKIYEANHFLSNVVFAETENELKKYIESVMSYIEFDSSNAVITSDVRIASLTNDEPLTRDVYLKIDNNYKLRRRSSPGVWFQEGQFFVGEKPDYKKNDNSPLPSDVSALIKGKIYERKMIEIKKEIEKIENEVKKRKNIHFSFDDSVVWTSLIKNSEIYSSIFDNEFLNFLKSMHEKYGAVFTLNVFTESGSYRIEDVPSKFSSDFLKNLDWLKFAFHARNNSKRYDVDDVEGITNSYNTFTSSVLRFAGSYDAIDTFTRLGFFTGTLNNIKAIRDLNVGVKGLFTADDTRISYYLNTEQKDFLLKHCKYFDCENQLILIKSQTRLESISNARTFLANIPKNQQKYLEIFTHEYEFNENLKIKIETLCQTAKELNYSWTYFDDIFEV